MRSIDEGNSEVREKSQGENNRGIPPFKKRWGATRRYTPPAEWPSPELPLTQWNVLDRARIPVNDHVVWEPVDFLFSVFVDVGITDVHHAHIFHLG
jgi:hypothetical protein